MDPGYGKEVLPVPGILTGKLLPAMRGLSGRLFDRGAPPRHDNPASQLMQGAYWGGIHEPMQEIDTALQDPYGYLTTQVPAQLRGAGHAMGENLSKLRDAAAALANPVDTMINKRIPQLWRTIPLGDMMKAFREGAEGAYTRGTAPEKAERIYGQSVNAAWDLADKQNRTVRSTDLAERAKAEKTRAGVSVKHKAKALADRNK